MTAASLTRNTIAVTATLKNAMETLNQGVNGIVFVVDAQFRVQGILTDGDVRRALLAGDSLDASAARHMNTRFQFAPAGLSRNACMQKLSDKIRHLPILDAEGRLVDYLSWADLWKKPVMCPELGGNELKYVCDCVTSTWISSQGEYVRAFEDRFARRHDVPYAIATMNCTCALHLCLVALGIGPEDEVIVPDLTFVATAAAVRHAGARPVLVDVDAAHWNMDPARVAAAVTPRTKALLPVHLYGMPCDMDPLLDRKAVIAQRH